MTAAVSHNLTVKDRWAQSLCFTAAVLLSLEALHPGTCSWMGLNDENSFALSASMATVFVFLATFIAGRPK